MKNQINIRVSQDKRYIKKNSTTAPLRLVISRGASSAMIDLGISVEPDNWDRSRQEVIRGNMKHSFNSILLERKVGVKKIIDRLSEEGSLNGLTVTEIKNKVTSILFPEIAQPESNRLTFVSHMKLFMGRKKGGTLRLYEATLKRLREFKDDMDNVTFEDITMSWLRDFDDFLSPNSPSVNARNIHLRNIRAIFNDAINEELITVYPFRKFKIRPEKTRKRAMTVERLREILTSDPVAEWERRYADCFKLMFLLCGINIVDLYGLDSIQDGRINYTRAKTHRLYSIKVEPEALDLIEKWKGKRKLLCYADTTKNYRLFYNRLSYYLKGLDISTYWARHSWATMAANLDIPKETIAAALGHGGNTVTDIYIDFDQKKVDEANRKVIDWVLYGKK